MAEILKGQAMLFVVLKKIFLLMRLKFVKLKVAEMERF